MPPTVTTFLVRRTLSIWAATGVGPADHGTAQIDVGERSSGQVGPRQIRVLRPSLRSALLRSASTSRTPASLHCVDPLSRSAARRKSAFGSSHACNSEDSIDAPGNRRSAASNGTAPPSERAPGEAWSTSHSVPMDGPPSSTSVPVAPVRSRFQAEPGARAIPSRCMKERSTSSNAPAKSAHRQGRSDGARP